MESVAWERPEESDHVLVIADDEPLHLRALCERLAASPGRARASVLGRYPRFRVIPASDGDEAIAKVTPDVSVVALDLMMPRRDGIEVIQELRMRRPDLAILAFTGAAPASDAVASMVAGADHFHEYVDLDSFEHAVDLAIDRRRLTRLIEQSQAAAADARSRLETMHGNLGALAGFRPPQSRDSVLPFQVAARRYLLAAARLFDGDPQGLAGKLGVSYFALRRMLKRYDVPFPGRTRRSHTAKG
jgi:DNA-binding NarL/FixJ family response regulator